MRSNEERIKYLESKLPVPEEQLEEKYKSKFDKYATYRGNGVYEWRGLLSSDTRELWLMGILRIEKVEFKEI